MVNYLGCMDKARSNTVKAKSLWRGLAAAALIGGLMPAAHVVQAGESPEQRAARTAADMVIGKTYLKADPADVSNTDLFGRSVAIDGDTMIVGAPYEDATGSNYGAAYVYVKQSGVWTQQARLVMPPGHGNAEAQFGFAVGISGDTAVVAAIYEKGTSASTLETPVLGTDKAGAAYVFVRNGTTWTVQAYLKASNVGEDDEFGQKLAIDGDTIVVTSELEDGDSTSTAAAPNDNAEDAGAAYVFVRNGTTWTQQAYLKSSNIDANDYFGVAVDLQGDTLVVGAYGESGDGSSPDNNGSNSSGAAYVFTRSDGVWTQQQYLKAGNVGAFDSFGSGVTIDGDYIAVGAYYESGDASSTAQAPNDNAISAGAVYIFAHNGVSWTQQAYLKASNAEADDSFGESVVLQGSRLVVGVPSEDGSNSSTAASPNNLLAGAGAVYVFDRVGSTWSQNAYVKALYPSEHDAFGGAIAMDGDTLLVGASREDGDGSSTGAATNENASSAGAAYIIELRSGALADLSLGFGTLTPAFDPQISEYTMTVPLSVTSIAISPTIAHVGATFAVATAAGPCAANVCDLVEGENVITVTVTFALSGRPSGSTVVAAPASSSVREYVITASRFASTNAALSALALSAGALTPAFASATTSYTTTVPNATASVTITPTTEDVNATAVVSGAAGPCPSNACPLTVGANTLTVTVTAQDTTTTRAYVIVATREEQTDWRIYAPLAVTRP
jgi:hypothetical protein